MTESTAFPADDDRNNSSAPGNAAYRLAKERYATVGVDVDQALGLLSKISVSVHCWQGDDVRGFEQERQPLSGGIAVTGKSRGRARNVDELRGDLEQAYSLIPGNHRLNLHAIYGEFETQVDRDQIGPEHFQGWIDWARDQGVGLDFNPTFFSHQNADDGFTLAHPDSGIRNYWIDHGIACRQIGAAMGQALASTCITNFWVPDGYKDQPASRSEPRERLARSLDEIFCVPVDAGKNLDSVESKLFGIGSESYVVGSHEFYLGYAITRKKLLCLDAGHFHPTEVISDKISAVMSYLPKILLHVSRGVRWDSDHVVTFDDELQAITREIVRGDYLDRVHLGLDYFDASINRVAAWVIGTRNLIKSMLVALLEPTEMLKQFEREGDFTSRLALIEELKTFPYAVLWDYYCMSCDVPVGTDWLAEIKNYEQEVLLKRSSFSESPGRVSS